MSDGQTNQDVQVKTIVYKNGGGTGTMANETVNVGSKWTVPACKFNAPANKKFDKWQYSLSGATKTANPGDQIDIDAEGTLEVTALWIDMVKVVSFNSNGGKGTMANVNAALGQYTVPQCGFTAPSGKEFAYWSEVAKDTDASKRHNPNDKITFDNETALTLYAIWRTKQAPDTIDTQEEKTLLYAATVEIDDLGFANPTKENKDFCVDFVAKSDTKTYTPEVVATVKAAM